jgi:hypothetical protein
MFVPWVLSQPCSHLSTIHKVLDPSTRQQLSQIHHTLKEERVCIESGFSKVATVVLLSIENSAITKQNYHEDIVIKIHILPSESRKVFQGPTAHYLNLHVLLIFIHGTFKVCLLVIPGICAAVS